MKKRLALFDFDGTITSHDSLFDIAQFSYSRLIYWSKIFLMLPIFALMKLRLLSKQRGKEFFLKTFFTDFSTQEFNTLCKNYCEQSLPKILRPLALTEIQNHLQYGAEIYVVSASPENWIAPWASPLGIKIIATQLEVKNEKISGNIAGKNCNGQEKVNRIKQTIDLDQYDEIFAYGDSKGDLPMFELATSTNYKPFT